ncbi:MAG: transcription termination factor NusA [Parcubacteria group bacterium RIFCSPLOWO2_01_FULL_40_65]|nr:MAG: transcription termination factor NusA [Parcubacteria group bacterium RIFCSPHIGHO2_01_FULL_40_30]OHB19381.1 MAG: transcription termination factor NusA [Parcubacteria group bacterium RIFCSPHIGHO2_02_FULL_40_12]OHB21247.1 MAG: transcription termination factor NusA [Parcubacteria group bacterium RIFCSPLOWO2_01_FULL_40_65]OHB23561.1 MAG: transcription termination factor NusA [Parcubacteria group bacterium RIFCSPLOWO2_02_FULL_40_12]OHB24313.1 MAG: transcription termination factor NusA [Parcub
MLLDIKQFSLAIKQIAEEKGISEQRIIDTIDAAIASAYKKDYGKKGQIIRAKLDPLSGRILVWQVKYAVEGVDDEGYITGFVIKRDDEIPFIRSSEDDESGDLKIKFNPEKHILIEEAKKINPDLKPGDELTLALEEKADFGRIAAQTAKQVVVQRLREAERESIADEYRKMTGSLVSGAVQRREGRAVYLDIGRTLGLLPFLEQSLLDDYSVGRRFRVLILSIDETPKGPMIILSRSHPRLLEKLFELEVPEISAGSVLVKGVSREAGFRSKIAVASKESHVDPIGSLVGQKGIRVQTVINELSGEKIDIIEWSDDPAKFIANALSPAKVLDVKILSQDKKYALIEVAEDQFSLAIGKRGQNVRLAAKLVGWKIDVRSPKEEMKAEEIENQESKNELQPQEN